MSKREVSGLVILTLGAIGVVTSICSDIYNSNRVMKAIHAIGTAQSQEARQQAESNYNYYDAREKYSRFGVPGSLVVTVLGKCIYDYKGKKRKINKV